MWALQKVASTSKGPEMCEASVELPGAEHVQTMPRFLQWNYKLRNKGRKRIELWTVISIGTEDSTKSCFLSIILGKMFDLEKLVFQLKIKILLNILVYVIPKRKSVPVFNRNDSELHCRSSCHKHELAINGENRFSCHLFLRSLLRSRCLHFQMRSAHCCSKKIRILFSIDSVAEISLDNVSLYLDTLNWLNWQ